MVNESTVILLPDKLDAGFKKAHRVSLLLVEWAFFNPLLLRDHLYTSLFVNYFNSNSSLISWREQA